MGDVGVVLHLGPGHITDYVDLHVLVAFLIEVSPQLLEDVGAVHVRHVADVVLGGDGVRQDGARTAREHVAAPDAIQIERSAVARHGHDLHRLIGDKARHTEVFRGFCRLQLLRLFGKLLFSSAVSPTMLS